MKEQRINSKLGVAWYPDNWHGSDTQVAMKNNPALQLAYLNVIWHLTREGGRAKITKEQVKNWMFCSVMRNSTWLALRSHFAVDSEGFWGHKSVDKRLKKAQNYSDSNKERVNNRVKFNSGLGHGLGHNPKKGDGAERKPIPPLKKMNEETELPEWAKEQP